MIRILFFNLLLGLLLLTFGFGYFIFLTTPGLAFDINLLAKLLPGQLQVEEVKGQLLSTFTLNNLSYHDAQNIIQIKSVNLSWNPRDLLRNQLTLKNLDIDQAKVTWLPTQQKPSSSWKVPFSRVSVEELNLNQIKLNLLGQNIDLTGSLKNSIWDMAWQVNIPHLEKLIPNISGTLSSNGTINGPFLTPVIKAKLESNQLNFAEQKIDKLTTQASIQISPKALATFKIDAYDLKINNQLIKKLNLAVTGNAERVRNKLLTHSELLINNQYKILTNIILPQFSYRMDQAVTGEINFSLNDLNLLSQFIPQIKNPRGVLQTQISLSGTLSQPQFIGDVNLTQGQATLPALGITLNQIQLHAKTLANNEVRVAGSFKSGEGLAQLQGEGKYLDSGFQTSVAIEGNNLQAVNLHNYKINISPDLTLRFENHNLDLRGKIFIPKAKIHPANYSDTITLPSEVVFDQQKKPNSFDLPFTTSLQLNIALGKDISLKYQELKAIVNGQVEITQRPQSLATATGELFTTDGTYNAYGTTLNIQNGRFIYTGGSLLNPGLSISAIKKIKSVSMVSGPSNFASSAPTSVYNGTQFITAGVRVGGTLEKPTFALFSDNNLSQQDILSYLLFGYPQSTAGSNKPPIGALLSAASAASPGSSNLGDITKKIKKTLGVNELTFTSTEVFNPATNKTESTPTLEVGKQLSPNLSIHYSQGVFNPVSTLNLRYQLSKRWAIQSETGTLESGADLMYSIERD